MRATVVTVAILFVGCAAVDIRGPHANRLSSEDIRQIKAFVISDSHLISPWVHITTVAPDRVQVEHGGLTSSDAMSINGKHVTKFFVVKRHGRWSVDERFGLEGTAEITAW